jgi:tight adherence protein C
MAARFICAVVLGLAALRWADAVPIVETSQALYVVVTAGAAMAGWLLPAMFIDFRLRQRTKTVISGLPSALELLVVCVEAGLSLEDGLDRVVTEIGQSQPALADELALTLAELKILPDRDRALTNLAERVDVPAVRSIIATLSQTLQYGTPLARSLRVVAAELRNEFLLQMEERANRLPVYLTLPVVLLILPTIFLVLGGPAILQVIDTFQR